MFLKKLIFLRSKVEDITNQEVLKFKNVLRNSVRKMYGIMYGKMVEKQIGNFLFEFFFMKSRSLIVCTLKNCNS